MIASFIFPSLLGFALLLSGMKVMETSLQQWAGRKLSNWVSRSTETPLRGFVVGTAASALLQSSTAVTVLTIGFVNAGWLTLSRSFGIILGTNVGTCFTTELMSLQLHRYGEPLLVAGAFGWMITFVLNEMRDASSAPRWGTTLRYVSVAVGGFGLLLVGFKLLQGMGPALRENELFEALMRHTDEYLLWGVLGGAALTALVHSSAAVIAMCMGLAATGAISPEAGVAIVLGANIGTCFTGLVASLGGGPGGRFVALSQLVLNAGGALLFYPLIGILHAAAAYISPGDPSAQIAHAQTIFNVLCSVIALPIAYLPVWRNADSGNL
ncbi:Na/Pi cotransporter family protein [Cohnella cholangitidis]|uniref:Na/Pi cotransporter family protein n=1 Tax=Cohnella cholangitidis TaxID=2598458 RepID=A0A7G5BU08_9BACL|nr:Na/Pi symporter [Cohnella cholangitidis]QMV40442.1 Na/Pi cotransporter family protein [Cohnella cholangitidis]